MVEIIIYQNIQVCNILNHDILKQAEYLKQYAMYYVCAATQSLKHFFHTLPNFILTGPLLFLVRKERIRLNDS